MLNRIRFRLNMMVINNDTNRLRNRLNREIGDLRRYYGHLIGDAEGLDSATNAKFNEILAANLRKNEVVVETLDKLLLFIRNSARQIETTDRDIQICIDALRAESTRGAR